MALLGASQKHEEKRTRYLSRLTEMLSSEERFAGEEPNLPSSQTAPMESFPSPERMMTVEPAAAAVRTPSPPAPTGTVQAAHHEADGGPFQQAARQIADALEGVVANALREFYRQAGGNSQESDETAPKVERISEDLHKVQYDLDALFPIIRSVADREAELRSDLAVMQDSSTRESAATRGRIDNLSAGLEQDRQAFESLALSLSRLEARVLTVSERLETVDQRLREQAEAVVRLSASSASLEQGQGQIQQRLEVQGGAIEEMRGHASKRGGLVERFLDSMRAIDQRREVRVPANKAVTVTARGGQEPCVSGRVVDTSAHGLGLVLPGPMQVGSELQVNVGGAVVCGRVSRCEVRADGYGVGLSLAQGTPGIPRSPMIEAETAKEV